MTLRQPHYRFDGRPPREIADLHDEAAGVVERLTAAEQAMADLAAHLEATGGTYADLWSSPQAQAFLQTDEKAQQLCRMAQSTFDATRAREVFGDTPWVPPEMRDVIVVVLDCGSDEG